MSDDKDTFKDRDLKAITKRMRAMDDTTRESLIADSPNVIGFERIKAQAKSVELRDGYRKPGNQEDK